MKRTVRSVVASRRASRVLFVSWDREGRALLEALEPRRLLSLAVYHCGLPTDDASPSDSAVVESLLPLSIETDTEVIAARKTAIRLARLGPEIANLRLHIVAQGVDPGDPASRQIYGYNAELLPRLVAVDGGYEVWTDVEPQMSGEVKWYLRGFSEASQAGFGPVLDVSGTFVVRPTVFEGERIAWASISEVIPSRIAVGILDKPVGFDPAEYRAVITLSQGQWQASYPARLVAEYNEGESESHFLRVETTRIIDPLVFAHLQLRDGLQMEARVYRGDEVHPVGLSTGWVFVQPAIEFHESNWSGYQPVVEFGKTTELVLGRFSSRWVERFGTPQFEVTATHLPGHVRFENLRVRPLANGQFELVADVTADHVAGGSAGFELVHRHRHNGIEHTFSHTMWSNPQVRSPVALVDGADSRVADTAPTLIGQPLTHIQRLVTDEGYDLTQLTAVVSHSSWSAAEDYESYRAIGGTIEPGSPPTIQWVATSDGPALAIEWSPQQADGRHGASIDLVDAQGRVVYQFTVYGSVLRNVNEPLSSLIHTGWLGGGLVESTPAQQISPTTPEPLVDPIPASPKHHAPVLSMPAFLSAPFSNARVGTDWARANVDSPLVRLITDRDDVFPAESDPLA